MERKQPDSGLAMGLGKRQAWSFWQARVAARGSVCRVRTHCRITWGEVGKSHVILTVELAVPVEAPRGCLPTWSQRRGLSVRCDWYCRQGGSWEQRHPVRGGSLGLKERQDLNVGWGQRKEVEKKPEGGDNAKRKLPALRGPGLFAPCLSSRAEHNSWNTAIFLIDE